jgi:hypothetical protein
MSSRDPDTRSAHTYWKLSMSLRSAACWRAAAVLVGAMVLCPA